MRKEGLVVEATDETKPICHSDYEMITWEGATMEQVTNYVLVRWPKSKVLRKGASTSLIFVSGRYYVGECWRIGCHYGEGFMILIARRD